MHDENLCPEPAGSDPWPVFDSRGRSAPGLKRRCSTCRELKPANRTEFAPAMRGRLGLTGQCRDCLRVIWREKSRRRYAANPDLAREISREAQRKLRDADPEAYRRASSEWRKANADRVKAMAKRADAKRASTPEGAMAMRMRAAIGRALRSVGSSKRRRNWELLVGYTVDDLRAHIERQFAKGMCWANAGEWHLDHIVPLSTFKFASAEDPEFRAAWALSNLRPLWAGDNHKKQAKRLHLL